MRLKDGFQVCPRCGGQGCWRCERQGFVVQCPACANTANIERDEDEFTCSICGAVFGKAGDVQRYEEQEEPAKRDPNGVPAKKTQRKPF